MASVKNAVLTVNRKPRKVNMEENDINSEERKSQHLTLAKLSQTDSQAIDRRFYYEPLLGHHPDKILYPQTTLVGKVVKAPLWVSSMTGGTSSARQINKNLALACKQHGMAMGLGSCRSLLQSDEFLEDFNVRKYIGDQPLFANLGIAQIDKIIQSNAWESIRKMLDKLEVDGLIIHINPLQEWLQPEGDRYFHRPIDLVKKVMDLLNIPIIVKEVGHGMGPQSLAALLSLPLEAVEFAASGGTNFSTIELLRSSQNNQEWHRPIAHIGHTATEMITMVNDIVKQQKIAAKTVIISGGIQSYLDGYHALQTIDMPAMYGQAYGFLKYALQGEEALDQYVRAQLEGLNLCYQLLVVKK